MEIKCRKQISLQRR